MLSMWLLLMPRGEGGDVQSQIKRQFSVCFWVLQGQQDGLLLFQLRGCCYDVFCVEALIHAPWYKVSYASLENTHLAISAMKVNVHTSIQDPTKNPEHLSAIIITTVIIQVFSHHMAAMRATSASMSSGVVVTRVVVPSLFMLTLAKPSAIM